MLVMNKRRWIALFIVSVLVGSTVALSVFYSDEIINIVTDVESKDKVIVTGGSWWDSDWLYYKELSISDNLAEYQMKLIVEYNNDTDIFANISTNGKSNTDFSDLRFIVDDSVECPYWYENKTDSSSIIVWVNTTTENPASIFMYYGNVGASSSSDGDATWDYFDDFDDLDDWSVVGGTWNADGVCHQTDAAAVIHEYGDGLVLDNPPSVDKRKVGTRCRTVSGYPILDFQVKGQDSNDYLLCELRDNGEIFRLREQFFGSWGTLHDQSFTFDTGTYYSVLIKVDDDEVEADVDGVTVHDFTDSDWDKAWIGIGLGGYQTVADFDWLFVGKYEDAEPYWSAFGSESDFANVPPALSGISPENESGNVSLEYMRTYVVVTDTDGDTMTVTWRSNWSGDWLIYGINTSVASGTNISQFFGNASFYNTSSWWCVNVTDDSDWVNATYHFTTAEEGATQGSWDYGQTLVWCVNTSGITILKLSDTGNLAIAGSLYENTNSPDPALTFLVNMTDSFWLTDDGDLYLKDDFYEES